MIQAWAMPDDEDRKTQEQRTTPSISWQAFQSSFFAENKPSLVRQSAKILVTSQVHACACYDCDILAGRNPGKAVEVYAACVVHSEVRGVDPQGSRALRLTDSVYGNLRAFLQTRQGEKKRS